MVTTLKYIFLGLLTGFLFSLIPVSVSGGGPLFMPAWHSDKERLSHTKISIHDFPDIRYVAAMPDMRPLLLDGNGAVVRNFVNDGSTLYSFSSDGTYYCSYSKTGNEISFHSAEGIRFWALPSPQYPLLSPHGSMVVLQVADMGTLHLLDKNGKKMEPGELRGRFCTALSFSDNEWLLAGFAGSDVYIVNNKGEVVHSLNTPEKTIVKSAALSANALFAAVHYGNEKSDGVMIIDITSAASKLVELKNRHLTRTALHVSDNGECHVLNTDELVSISANGQISSKIAIPLQNPGTASIAQSGSFLYCSYTRHDRIPVLLIFSAGTKPLMLSSLEFPGERALRVTAVENLVIAEGTKNLYTWHVR